METATQGLAPRVAVRDWRPDDLEAMHRWYANPEVTRFLSWGGETLEDSARHLEECVAQASDPERSAWFLAVELPDSGRVIGSVGIHFRSRRYGDERGRGEGGLGYFLEPDFWGRGLATDAARLVVELGFGELGMHKISASCDAGNVGSERVMQKLGMTGEAAFRHAHRRFGAWRDRLWYGLLREEWESRRAQ